MRWPGRFLDFKEAVEHFERYFRWHNEEHYHSGIDYVTPNQVHKSLRGQIVFERRNNLQKVSSAAKGGAPEPANEFDRTAE